MLFLRDYINLWENCITNMHMFPLTKHYNWAMAEDVDSWCASCLVCAAHNQGKPGRTKLCRPNAPKGPWEALQMDFSGPLPSAKGGYRYCLVVIDKFSKWVDAIPTRNNSTRTVARVLANQIFPLFALVRFNLKRCSSHFTGQVMKDMFNIKQRFHIPYRPQSSGMVEWVNRTIKEHIAKTYCPTQEPVDWCIAHSFDCFASNSIKSHRYQPGQAHDSKSYEAPRWSRNLPRRSGPSY